MSKYTDILADKYRCHCGTCEVQKGNASEEECEICSHYTIREALQIADRLECAYHNAFGIDLAKCTKYGNESAEQQRDSYSTVMMYEVAGVFEDVLGE